MPWNQYQFAALALLKNRKETSPIALKKQQMIVQAAVMNNRKHSLVNNINLERNARKYVGTYE